MRWAGVDFGTTNSAVAFVDDAGVPVLAQIPGTHGPQPTFPVGAHFEPEANGARTPEKTLCCATCLRQPRN